MTCVFQSEEKQSSSCMLNLWTLLFHQLCPPQCFDRLPLLSVAAGSQARLLSALPGARPLALVLVLVLVPAQQSELVQDLEVERRWSAATFLPLLALDFGFNYRLHDILSLEYTAVTVVHLADVNTTETYT